jgi:tRNA (cytidine/uridine-2'-O-)-methyltransferase
VKVLLYQPEIPQNTGNIVRTCALTQSGLVLVRPLGFSISDKQLKRAGLDYWASTQIEVIDHLVAYLEASNSPFYFFSRYAESFYTEISYSNEDLLIFGSETGGLPAIVKEKWPDRFYTIPCTPIFRKNNPRDSGCLNLSNAVSIILYEALRQNGFSGCREHCASVPS